jgi:hypothetical protein
MSNRLAGARRGPGDLQRLERSGKRSQLQRGARRKAVPPSPAKTAAVEPVDQDPIEPGGRHYPCDESAQSQLEGRSAQARRLGTGYPSLPAVEGTERTQRGSIFDHDTAFAAAHAQVSRREVFRLPGRRSEQGGRREESSTAIRRTDILPYYTAGTI